MQSIYDLEKSLLRLQERIEFILMDSGYDYNDGIIVEYNTKNPDDLCMRYKLNNVMDRLYKVNLMLSDLRETVAYEGYICKWLHDKYWIDHEFPLSCGCRIEVLITIKAVDEYDPLAESKIWWPTRVEYTDERGYYLIGLKDVPMDGLKARIRW